MSWPVDPARAYLRNGPFYWRDAFGATEGRVVPHTGIDFTAYKGVDPGPIYSVYGGEIVRTGRDREAGIFYIEDDWLGRYWIGAHSAELYVSSGERTHPSADIGAIGSTGNSTGTHLHLMVATSRAAADRVIDGYVDTLGGRSVAEWAAGMGLLDPLPLIQQSPEDTMSNAQFEALSKQIQGVQADVDWMKDAIGGQNGKSPSIRGDLGWIKAAIGGSNPGSGQIRRILADVAKRLPGASS